MPTTTNFGWTTPADTDLVKDGAAAIRTLAGNIDTSLVDLKGGTTGQVLSKASNTDLDFTFTTITAGGITLLSTTSLTGTETTISGISGSYKNLYVVIEGIYSSGTLLQMYLNSDAFTNYNTWGLKNTSADDRSDQAATFARIGYPGKNSSGASNELSGIINIYNYASANNKTWNAFTSGKSSTDQRTGTIVSGSYYGAAITSIKFDLDGSSFGGGTAKVYGVN
jgi:hypothetical protein